MCIRDSRTPFDPSAQNVYWTLALGGLAMAGLKRFEKENGLPGWQAVCLFKEVEGYHAEFQTGTTAQEQ